MSKTAPEKNVVSRLSSWRRDWKPFIKRTLRHAVLQFPSCLAMSSLAVLVLASVLYVSLRSSGFREKLWGWIEELTVTSFIIVVTLFATSLILVFVFSLHPKTRRMSSKLSTFIDEPEVEILKERVSTLENKLDSIHKRLDGLDGKTDTTNMALAEMKSSLNKIERRLQDIQGTMKILANPKDVEDKHD